MPQVTPITEGGSAKSLARFGVPAHDDWQVKEDDTGSFAKIVVPAAGGSGTLRPTITGTKKHPTGMYPSYKTGLTQYWEGETERGIIHEAETYPQIVDYQMQPYRIEFTLDGARVSYTPDQVRQYVDGYVEWLEAKSSDRYFADPAYSRMLLRVENLIGHVGIGFRRVTMRDVYSSRRHEKNVGIVQSRRFVSVTIKHLARVQALREEGRVLLAMGELAERLEPTQLLYGLALVQALMVRRHLHIDLKSPLGPDTAVWVLPEPTPFHSTMRI